MVLLPCGLGVLPLVMVLLVFVSKLDALQPHSLLSAQKWDPGLGLLRCSPGNPGGPCPPTSRVRTTPASLISEWPDPAPDVGSGKLTCPHAHPPPYFSGGGPWFGSSAAHANVGPTQGWGSCLPAPAGPCTSSRTHLPQRPGFSAMWLRQRWGDPGLCENPGAWRTLRHSAGLPLGTAPAGEGGLHVVP